MEDLSKRVKLQATFNEQSMQPMRKNRNDSKAINGKGLLQSGATMPTGGFAAAIPILSSLATQAAPGIAKGVWSGLKKVGKWFGRLFRKRRGRGIQGGMRDDRDNDNTDASYHDFKVHNTGMRIQDMPVQGYDVNYKSKMPKYEKWYSKLDQGEGIEYTEGGMMSIIESPEMQQRIMRYKKRPHKLMNLITNELRKAQQKNM